MTKPRFTHESHEALFEFIASSHIFLEEKDHYLDALLSDKKNVEPVQTMLRVINRLIAHYQEKLGIAIWNEDKNTQDTISLNLHVANYVQHHLNAALDRLNPSIKSIYYYLLNSERTDQAKYAYLRKIKKEKHGVTILYLVKKFAEDRRADLKTIFGDAAHIVEDDLLNTYPAAKLSAEDVCQLITDFNSKPKPSHHHAVYFKRAASIKITVRHQNTRKL